MIPATSSLFLMEIIQSARMFSVVLTLNKRVFLNSLLISPWQNSFVTLSYLHKTSVRIFISVDKQLKST